MITGDVGDEEFCRQAVARTVEELGRLDVLVNNAAEQHEQDSLEKISAEQLARTFPTNVFGYFFMTKAALPHLKEGSAIVNTTSVTAYRGSAAPDRLFVDPGRRASPSPARWPQSLAGKGIRVNGVAPGPIWTPLIPASFDAEKVAKFGQNVPLGRPGQPNEVAHLPSVPRLRRQLLHDRPGPAPERRRDRRRLRRLPHRLAGASSAFLVVASHDLVERPFVYVPRTALVLGENVAFERSEPPSMTQIAS